jgi:hypothetical protein
MLAAAWKAEMVEMLTLQALAQMAREPRLQTRIASWANVAKAHTSRLLTRIAALGGGPLPVPPDEVEVTQSLCEALAAESDSARFSAERYAVIALAARKIFDPSTAWICELNRAEELERANELSEFAQTLREKLALTEAME